MMWSWRIQIIIFVFLAQLVKVLRCGVPVRDSNDPTGGFDRRLPLGLFGSPYFDPSSPNNITAQYGTHAYLPCKIRQLSNKSVSWIRRRDAHILTVDRFTFIADERFQAFLLDHSDTWTLQVKYVQPRDAGLYECQVGTEPKMSHFVQLNVVVPVTTIAGGSDVFVRSGSFVALRCIVSSAMEDPAYIFWFHNGERLLDQQSLIKIRRERVPPDTTVGILSISSARREDAGNYSCVPSSLASASVMLHVLTGEQPAAMQDGNSSSSLLAPSLHLVLFILGGYITSCYTHLNSWIFDMDARVKSL